jgi:hypothetical protein
MLAWEEVGDGGTGSQRAVPVRERAEGQALLRVRRGPSEDELAKAFLAVQALAASSSPPSRPRPRGRAIPSLPYADLLQIDDVAWTAPA